MSKICCALCDEKHCDGCNVYILQKMLYNGKFDSIMKNRTIDPNACLYQGGLADGTRSSTSHGYWEPHNEDNPFEIYGKCSLCGFEQSISDKLRYCPNCGARMGVGEDKVI